MLNWNTMKSHFSLLPSFSHLPQPVRAFLVAVKDLPAMQESWVRSLGWDDVLEKGLATHSSTLAWRIPWTEEPGGLQSMGLTLHFHFHLVIPTYLPDQASILEWVLPALSINRMLWLLAVAATLDWEALRELRKETRNACHLAATRLQQLPEGTAWGNSGWENRTLAQRAKVHLKGLISLSPNYHTFPYTEKS